MRLSLIIMFVFRSIFIYYRRACHGTCVQRLEEEEEEDVQLCDLWTAPRSAMRLLTACVHSPDSRAKKKYTQKPAPKCGTCLGNCKLVSLNINALSNPNRSEHSLHNCRVWRDILATTPNSSNLICVHWLQFMAQSQLDLAPGQLQAKALASTTAVKWAGPT